MASDHDDLDDLLGFDSEAGPEPDDAVEPEVVDVEVEQDPYALATPTELKHAQWDEALEQAPDRKRVPFGLAYRQWLFLMEYLIDFNGAQAAIRAGYKSKSAAGRLLRHPVICNALEWLLDKRAEMYSADHSRVLQGLVEIAYADPADTAKWGPGHFSLLESSQVPARKRRAIKSITFRETASESGVSVSTKIEYESRLKALEMVAKATGLFRDKESDDNRGAFRAWYDGVMSGDIEPATREIEVEGTEVPESRGDDSEEE